MAGSSPGICPDKSVEGKSETVYSTVVPCKHKTVLGTAFGSAWL